MPWKLEEVRSNQGLRMNEQLFAVVGVPFEHDRKTEYEQHVVLVNLVYSDGVGVTGDHHYPKDWVVGGYDVDGYCLVKVPDSAIHGAQLLSEAEAASAMAMMDADQKLLDMCH
jgi:hypothetical protein